MHSWRSGLDCNAQGSEIRKTQLASVGSGKMNPDSLQPWFCGGGGRCLLHRPCGDCRIIFGWALGLDLRLSWYRPANDSLMDCYRSASYLECSHCYQIAEAAL